MLKLTKFPPPFEGGSTVYYTSHVMKRFIPHVRRGPWTSSKTGSKLADNKRAHGGGALQCDVAAHHSRYLCTTETVLVSQLHDRPVFFFVSQFVRTKKSGRGNLTVRSPSGLPAQFLFVVGYQGWKEKGVQTPVREEVSPIGFIWWGKQSKGLCGASV